MDYFADFALRAPAKMPVHYGVEFVDLEVTGEGEYPVVVTLKDEEAGERTVRAKYVIGADGARSGVRKAIGAQHEGSVSNHAWGVLDVIADTDFPDVRFKVAVSAASGSLLMIPREGWLDLPHMPRHIEKVRSAATVAERHLFLVPVDEVLPVLRQGSCRISGFESDHTVGVWLTRE